MSDNLNIVASVAPVAVRLPSGSAENQVLTNLGPATAILEGVANNVISAVGSSSVVTPGMPFPPGSKLRLIKNSGNIYANTTQLGGAVAAAPAVAASGTPVTNSTGGPVAVTLSGGTVTQVAVSGQVVLVGGTNVTGSVVSVPAGGTITLTYSVAPTWTWKYGVPANLQLQAGVETT